MVTAIGLVMGGGAYLLGEPLLGIYTSSPEVVSYGLIRLKYVCATYFLCGLMDVMVGTIRGMGYSIMPMLVSSDRCVRIPCHLDFHHLPDGPHSGLSVHLLPYLLGINRRCSSHLLLCRPQESLCPRCCPITYFFFAKKKK